MNTRKSRGDHAGCAVLSPKLTRSILDAAQHTRIVVVGDVILDHYLRGEVRRISPEAPVPVVDFREEIFLPGGAANVARNLTALGANVSLVGVIGTDVPGKMLLRVLRKHRVDCSGIVALTGRRTAIKTRIVAGTQQVVRVDRETKSDVGIEVVEAMVSLVKERLHGTKCLILSDYGKGVVTQELVNKVVSVCKQEGILLSSDPKPVHKLDLRGVSLMTPNRKEAFELAGAIDDGGGCDPIDDGPLLEVAFTILDRFHLRLLVITLGENGMLLVERGKRPMHIPTAAREVFDVSGAGDTVIAVLTLALAVGAAPIVAATIANHAAGVVVGKAGTASVSVEELCASVGASQCMIRTAPCDTSRARHMQRAEMGWTLADRSGASPLV